MKIFKLYLLLLCFGLSWVSCGEKKTYTRYVELAGLAGESIGRGDYGQALKHTLDRLQLSPFHPGLHYSSASLHALVDEPEQSLNRLKSALRLGFDFGDSLEPELRPFYSDPEVKQLITRMKTPINRSQVAVSLPERDLIPEGMAYNPLDSTFFMSSLEKCKIIRFDLNGNVSDFKAEKEDGLRPVVGMKVDAERRVFWAASELSAPRPDYCDDELGWACLFKYDLDTGALIKKYELFKQGERHLFNDVAINSKGDVYTSDSEFNAIYRVMADTDTLELFIQNASFFYPNGITMGGNDQTLYMASWGDGVYHIDIPTKKCRLVTHPDDMTLFGIDGIYYHEHSLVAVQNGLTRVARFYLNPDGKSVHRLKVLETRNPHFIIPTTGAIAGDTFYFIANSQMASRNRDGSLFSWDRLSDVVVLKTDLD